MISKTSNYSRVNGIGKIITYKFDNGTSYGLSIKPISTKYNQAGATGAFACKSIGNDVTKRVEIEGFNLGKKGQFYLVRRFENGGIFWPLNQTEQIIVDMTGKIKKLSADAMWKLCNSMGIMPSQLEHLNKAPKNYMQILSRIFRKTI